MLKTLVNPALGMCVLTLIACTNGHKLQMSKTLKPGKAQAAKAQNSEVQKLIDEDKTCLRIGSLNRFFAEKNAHVAFTVYIQSKALSDAGTLVNDPRANFWALIAPLKRLTETKYGSQMKTSELIGDLLNVSDQSDCSTVAFIKNGSEPEVYDVQLQVSEVTQKGPKNQPVKAQQQGAPGRLTLKSKDGFSSREYRITSDNNLVIDVYENLKMPVQSCDGTQHPVRTVTRYVVNLTGSDSGLVLGPRFAGLLDDYMELDSSLHATVQKLRDSAAKPPEPSEKGKRAPTTTGDRAGLKDGAVKVTNAMLVALGEDIKNKIFKPILCK